MHAIALCFSMVAHAGEPMGTGTFFDTRPGQVFTAQDEQGFQIGFLEGGNELPTLTWEGTLADRELYVELHGTTIKLITPKRRQKLLFQSAQAIQRKPVPGLDFNSARIFIDSGQGKSHSVLCIEAYGEGVHRSPPYKEVYIVLDPFGRARLFKMPSLNASSLGLVRLPDGECAVPEWTIDEAIPPNLTIQYHRLTQRGFVKEGEPMTGRYITSGDHLFELFSSTRTDGISPGE